MTYHQVLTFNNPITLGGISNTVSFDLLPNLSKESEVLYGLIA